MRDGSKKIRLLRKMGSVKLTKLRDELITLAWELSERNQTIGDRQIGLTLMEIDKSLVEIERALTHLNSIWLVDRNVAKIQAENLHNYKY